MKFEILYFLFFLLLIILLNALLKKFNFLLENEDKSSHRKIFLTNNKKIQSGGLFLTIVLTSIFYDHNIYLVTSLILMFFLGMFSDIEFISSPKIRFFFQIIIIIFLIIFTSLQIEYTKIYFLDSLIKNKIFNIVFTSFCILILINGCNFIDGANNLLINYFLIISLCLFILPESNDLIFDKIYLKIIISSLIALLIFNFFSIIIMGDSGSYVLGLFFGYLLINLSNQNLTISPIYIVNLLWYPAFENLFSILRKLKKNILVSKADNFHLHHLIYKIVNKIIPNSKFNNSITGLLINTFNLVVLFTATVVSNHSFYLTLILIFNITVYISIYFILAKKINFF